VEAKRCEQNRSLAAKLFLSLSLARARKFKVSRPPKPRLSWPTSARPPADCARPCHWLISLAHEPTNRCCHLERALSNRLARCRPSSAPRAAQSSLSFHSDHYYSQQTDLADSGGPLGGSHWGAALKGGRLDGPGEERTTQGRRRGERTGQDKTG